MKITNGYSFHGKLSVPGDKSISHRGIMFGAISNGLTEITNFLQGADCLSTISCFQKLGIPIENNGSSVLVHGKGLHGLRAFWRDKLSRPPWTVITPSANVLCSVFLLRSHKWGQTSNAGIVLLSRPTGNAAILAAPRLQSAAVI